MHLHGSLVAARIGGTYRRRTRDGADFIIVGGALQQFFRTLPVATMQRLQAFSQARARLLAAVTAPRTERQGEQVPQYPQ